MKMKFVKGLLIGGTISTSIMMMLPNNNSINTKKMAKKGKQIAKKMGIM